MKRFFLLIVLAIIISKLYSQDYKYEQILVINSPEEVSVLSAFHVRGDLKIKTKSGTLLLAKNMIKQYSLKLPLNDTIHIYSNQKKMNYILEVSDNNGNKNKKSLFFIPEKQLALTVKKSEKSIRIMETITSKKPNGRKESGWGLLVVLIIVIGIIKWIEAKSAKKA